METQNGQSAAKPLLNGEGPTTIPEGSTLSNKGKRPVYLKERYVVYKILNKTTNKFYIGSASYYDKRIGTHVALLRQQKHWNPYLQSAWNKYGESDFEFSIVEKSTKDSFVKREQHWLDVTQCYNREIGYNLSKLANSRLGTKMSQESKDKISAFFKGKPKSKEHRQKHIDRVYATQAKAVLVYDINMNLLAEYPSAAEASRNTNYSLTGVAKQARTKGGNLKPNKKEKLLFRYKDIV